MFTTGKTAFTEVLTLADDQLIKCICSAAGCYSPSMEAERVELAFHRSVCTVIMVDVIFNIARVSNNEVSVIKTSDFFNYCDGTDVENMIIDRRYGHTRLTAQAVGTEAPPMCYQTFCL